MTICPKCNGLEYTTYMCQTCYQLMEDYGRSVDYHDKYSPYLDEEITNKVDGLTDKEDIGKCMHVFYCQQCKRDQHIAIYRI